MTGTQIEDNSRKLLLFFTITFSISWVIWFLAPLISIGDILLFHGICVIGAYGPSISAIYITSREGKKTHYKDNLKKKKWIVFIIILIASFFSALSMFFFNQMISFSAVFIFIFASIIASFLFSQIFSSNSNISDLLKSIKGIKGKNIFILIGFFLPLLVNLGGVLVVIILGGIIPAGINLFIVLLYLTCFFPYTFFFGGALNEEIGWRGFAQPYLQKKYSPLITGLIIGIIWSAWHAPMHFNGAYGDGWWGFLIRFSYNVPFGIIYTWYYNKSQKNLLGAIILHSFMNIYPYITPIFPGSDIYSIVIYYIFLFFIIVYEKMWKKSLK